METSPRIAIHAHAFYPAIWPEIRQCIQNIIDVCGSDKIYLCVTYPEGHDEIAAIVGQESYSCTSDTVAFPNRGYDVAPFICAFLNTIDLNRFDYVVKLHTKRDVNSWINFHPLHGSEWREALLSFCASKQAFLRSLGSFEKYDRLGMIASHKVINYCGSDIGKSVAQAANLLKRDFAITPKHLVSASGTMFMVRASLLRTFQKRYGLEDFICVTAQNRHSDYGLAALLEFAFTLCTDANGYLISEGRWPPALSKAGYAIQCTVFSMLRIASDTVRRITSGL